MSAKHESDIDCCAAVFNRLGYSYGHHSSISRDGGELLYTVYAHRGDERIVAHAPTLERAYAEAASKANDRSSFAPSASGW